MKVVVTVMVILGTVLTGWYIARHTYRGGGHFGAAGERLVFAYGRC